jgi:type 1 glutamine amidotransferase/HEAT repeat protein
MTHAFRIALLLTFGLLATCSALVAAEAPRALSPDQAFDALKTWQDGQSHVPLNVLEQYVGRISADAAARAKAAERLAAILADPKATPAARKVVCHLLPMVASDAQVPMLAKMLDDPKAADLARGVLETIPGEASLDALRAALARQKGDALVGVINSLGARRDAAAVPAIARFVGDADAKVAAAAMRALGRIGTVDAAEVIMAVRPPAGLVAAAQDASLRCAGALAASGVADRAAAICESLMQQTGSPHVFAPAMACLAEVRPQAALPFVMQAMRSDDPLLRGTAANLARTMTVPGATEALAAEMGKAGPPAQTVIIMEVLAARGDRAAGPAVAKLLDSKDEAVRLAAMAAMGSLGDAACVEQLVRLAAGQGPAQAPARAALARLAAPEVDARLIALAAKGEPAVRAEAIRAVADRRSPGAGQVLTDAAGDADESVRVAAFSALATAGASDTYPRLIQMLVAAASPRDGEMLEKAVIAVGGRMAATAERTGPAVAALKSAPAKAKPALLRVLAAAGGPEALQAVRAGLKDPDAAIREAAVRALADWPDEAAAADLLALARDAESATHRTLALRGYLRLAAAQKDEAQRVRLLEQVRPIAKTADAKRMLLAGLGASPSGAALELAFSFLSDAEVRAEASAAVLAICRAMGPRQRAAVRSALAKFTASGADKAAAAQADSLVAEALKNASAKSDLKALQHDKGRSEIYKKELAKRAPAAYRLAAYLDCGPDAEDGAKSGPLLECGSGAPYAWAGSEAAAPERFGTVAFDGSKVVFRATGLSPRKTYAVGFTWWDYDHGTRHQSVWMAPGKGQKATQVLGKTKLPYGGAKEPPQEKLVAVPRDLYADGSLRIEFRREADQNAVVSEIWLWESEADGAPPPVAPAAAAPAAAKPAATPVPGTPPGAPAAGPPDFKLKPAKPEPGRTTRILIVTGMEHGAHNWRQTAPVLADELSKDPRLLVDVSENAAILGSPRIADYAAVVLNFMNPQPFDLGPGGRENFRRYVEGGKGLMLVHFACGAFHEWPEFRDLVARVWDPKLRGHDPRGPFRVEITDVKHPITEGLKAFDADDELYTCLAGDKPIEVLAKATSKVDKKDYPMAFVCTTGKGRVFQCLLGHDVKAMRMPGVGELYRRGCVWAAGLPPVAK